MGGDREAHDAMVAEQAGRLAAEVDVLVLAQASMQRLAGPLQEQTGLRVLSSPRIGVELLARTVREQLV